MPLKLLVGRSGSGKTHRILDEICHACDADPFGPPIFIIVPEQAAYQTEKAILTHGPIRGYTRVQVLGFARLANFVYTSSEAPRRPILTSQHRSLLALLLVHQWRSRRPGTFLDTPGIEESLAQLVAETHHQAVGPEALRRAIDRLSAAEDAESSARTRLLQQKLEILTEFLESYEEIAGERFHDPDVGLANLAEAIRSSPQFQGASVYLDSFIDFTPIEEQLIVALALRAANVVLSVQMDPSRVSILGSAANALGHPVFSSIEQGLARLLSLLDANGVKREDPIVLASSRLPRFRSRDLEILEEGFLRGRPRAEAPDDGVSLITAGTPREEARLAAEHAASLLRDHPNWSPADVAILVRGLEEYAEPLARHLTELRVPHFVDHAVPLSTHPFVVGIRALLAAAQHPGVAEHLIELGKSGLPPIPRGDVDFLDLHVRQYPRSRAEWMSDRPWNQPASRRFDEENEAPDDVFTPQVDSTRLKLVQPVLRLRAAILTHGSMVAFRPFLKALIGCIDEFLAGRELKEVDRRILGRIGELMADAADVVGEEELPLPVASQVIQQALAGLQLPRIPPLLDQVFVGQVDRSRQPAARAVIVLGLAEGTFPRPIANRTLLSDNEREMLQALNVDVRPAARRRFLREALFAYRTFAAPSEQLILYRPRGTNDGAPLEPSPYWLEVERLLGRTPHAAPPAETPERCWRPRELALATVRAFARGSKSPFVPLPSPAVIASQLPGIREEREVHRVLQASAWRNVAAVDGELVHDYLGGNLRLSATRLDSFGACGYQYFAAHLLRPQQLVRPEFESMDAGNYAHLALERFSRSVREGGLLERDHDAVEAAIEEALRIPREGLLKTGLLGTASGSFLHGSLDEILREMCRWILRAWRGGRARPIAEELPFANEFPIQDLPNWRVVLTGKIDRVDVVPDGEKDRAIIVDYKLSRRAFDFSDWIAGQSNQLPIYLLARPRGASLDPGSALYLDILPPMNRGKERGRLYSGLIDEGTLAAVTDPASDLKIASVIDVGSDNSPDGVAKKGSVVSDEDLRALIDTQHDLMAQLVRRIVASDFSIHPARHGKRTVCQHCQFGAICQIDYTINKARQCPSRPRAEVIKEVLRGGTSS